MILFDYPNNQCFVFENTNSDMTGNWVTVVGKQVVKPEDPYPLDGFPKNTLFDEYGGRCIDCYQIIWVRRGSGIFIDRGVEYSVSDGAMFILRPGVWHSYGPDKKTVWEEYYFGFSGEMFSRIIADGFPDTSSSTCILPEEEKIQKLFEKAIMCAREGTDVQLLLQGLLTLLISEAVVYSKSNPEGSKRTARLVAGAIGLMEKNISGKMNLHEIASQLGISYTGFNEAFKKQTGYPPVKYLRRMRLQRAKYALAKTSQSIKQIALSCGFSSTEYFCNFFHGQTGQTPSEYRSAVSQNLLGIEAETASE